MNSAHGLASLALAALLGACSPSPQSEEVREKSSPAETAAIVLPETETLAPVLDAEGNELDPQLADAVREHMASDQAAMEASEAPDAAQEPTPDET